MIKRTIRMVAVIVAAAGLACADKNFAPHGAFKNAAALNETAAFLAGLDLPPQSALLPAASDARYAAYKKHMDAAWGKYSGKELREIHSWVNEKIRGKYTDTVLYPFSGPDILNAAAFFPEAREFIMMGLEPPGEVPDPSSLPQWKVVSELWGINTALRTLLSLNYFRTAEMQADIKSNTFTSITGIMMFFLARSGYEILEVSKVTVGPDGALRAPQVPPGAGDISGVEIFFRKNPKAPLKRACYFKVDLSDNSLKKLPQFMAYLEKNRHFTTFIKSASYLLGYNYFATLRSFILSRTVFMVQDDTGIPLRDLNPGEWNMAFYGRYRVLEMFKNRFQPDLAKVMKDRNGGLLPFSYGYGFVPERSHLMLVERRKN